LIKQMMQKKRNLNFNYNLNKIKPMQTKKQHLKQFFFVFLL